MVFISIKNKKIVSYLSVAVILGSSVSNVMIYSHAEKLNQELVSVQEVKESLATEVSNLEQSLLNLEDVADNLASEKEILADENKALIVEVEDRVEENSQLSEENNSLLKKNKTLEEKLQSLTSKDLSVNSSASAPQQSTSTNNGGWKTMVVNASAYTLVEHGDKMGGTGLTSTGTVPTANRTIAVDPNVIPYGSLIQYNGVTYTAEDTGGIIKGNKVDIYMNTLSEALTFGRKDIEILVKVSK